MPKKKGPQMDLPDRAARKALLKELEEARRKGLGADVEGFENYAEKIRILDERMDEFGALDPWGLPGALTAEQKTALLAAMKEAGEAGEAFLENVKKKAPEDASVQPNKGIPGMVRKLQGILSRDTAALRNYDPEKAPCSLPELMEKSRCRTIELGSTRIEAKGGAQSSRIPMAIVNEKGEKRRGFLTKSSTVDIGNQFQVGIDAVVQNLPTNSEKSRKTKEQLNNMLRVYRQVLDKRSPNAGDEAAIAVMFSFFGKKTPLNVENVQKMVRNLGVTEPLPPSAYEALVKHWMPLTSVSTSINALELRLKKGDRLDVRNSAMNSVADLLGKPELLARSTDVRYTDGMGGVAEGTFMDYSKGLDLRTDDEHIGQFKKVADKPFVRKTREDAAAHGAFLKSVADLQVVDFLCGNVDRHSANLTYIADDRGRLIGVQGIDNDSSFGSIAPGSKPRLRLAGTANMGVISESMAKKITGMTRMTPAMLKFTLRGRGLSEEQLDFAGKRLEQLQEAIVKGEEHYKDKPLDPKAPLAYEEGFLRTVPDEEFSKLSIKKLCDPKPVNKLGWYKNLFGEIGHWIPGLVAGARYKGVGFEPKEKRQEEPDTLTKVDTVGKTMQEKMKLSRFKAVASGISNYVTFRDPGKYNGKTHVDQLTVGRNGSREFAEMVESVKHFEQMKKQLDAMVRRNPGDAPLNGQEYRRLYEGMQTALDTMDKKQDLYMERKLREKKVTRPEELRGKNPYERDRITYAKVLGKYVADVKKRFAGLEAPEALLKDRDEERAQAELRDLDDRKAAMEALRKLHEEKGLASPEELRSALRSDAPETRGIRDKFHEEQAKAAEEFRKAREKDPEKDGEPQEPTL